MAKPRAEDGASLSSALAFLADAGFERSNLIRIDARAKAHGVEPLEVLLRHGLLDERSYFQLLARHLNLSFVEPAPTALGGERVPYFDVPSLDDLTVAERLLPGKKVPACPYGALVAPNGRDIALLEDLIARDPARARRELAITTRTCAYSHMEPRAWPARLRNATEGLDEMGGDFSARITIKPRQAVLLCLVIQAILITAFLAPGTVVLGLHLVASAFYLSCVVLRLLASFDFSAGQRRVPPPGKAKVDRSQDHLLPTYCILVALYEEANQIEPLVAALMATDWPREKLDIVLVCEADDDQTIAAVRKAQQAWPDRMLRLECVPPGQPRTKPKALNFALPFCRGEYLVIYDAEDRPDPLQIREAFTQFYLDEEKSLGCLQAPLVIHNHREGFLPLLFTVEYSSLFDGLLPYLARRRLPLPLGGTSNHFRLSVLRGIGAWDAFNVTEDADLGLRLARLGYRIGVLRHPTYEEAPVEFMPWLRQRTRWFKGWLQTWLVHMRHPVQLLRDLGWRGTAAFHVLVTGMVVSALIHPVLLWFVAQKAIGFANLGWDNFAAEPLLLLDVTTVLLGYIAMGVLAWKTLPVRGLGRLRVAVFLLPAYWLLISIAAWRAVGHLIIKPHDWEKTPHQHRPLEAAEPQVETGSIPAFMRGGNVPQ